MTLPPPDSSPDDNDTQPKTTTGTIGPEGVARLLGGAAGLQPASPFAPGDPWPLQADRQAIRSGLVESLRIIAGHYGRRTSVTALTAGLPIPATGITPVLFVRAAARADLNARLVERPVDAIAIAPTLPCIIVLKGQQSCIVWDVKTPKGHAPSQKPGEEPDVHPETLFTVEFPETEGQRQDMTRDELRALQTGYVYYVRPAARLDDRAGPAEIDSARDWFWGAIKQHKKIYQEIGLAAVLINLFALANPLFVMNVYDRVVPNSAFDTLFVLSAGMGIVLVFELIMKTLRAHFLDYAGKKADVTISAQLFEQLLGMTLAARPASAGVLASNMREFEGIRDFFTSATLIALIDLPFAILFIIIIAFIAGPLALVVLAAVPIILLVGWQLQKPMRAIIKESLMENALKNALLFETITGLETIKTQAAEGHVQRRWEELSERAARTNVKSRRVSNFATNFSMFAQQAIGILTIMVGVYLISIGYVTMGALIATVMLSGRALAPMAQFAALMTRLHQTVAALKQLDDLMKKPVERPAGTHFITLSHVRGAVEFRDIVFKYPGSTIPAVNHLSFSIEAGEHIAIIGAVGSGKTTLQRLLLNMYQPDSGSVQLDGTDVRQIDPGDLRRAIGCVQQSPQLFYGSVRDNITMGHETAPDGAVIKAAEMAGVMEFLRDTQAGLDTPVGERGEQLSGGQRQAVAIARSLLYDPPVMILDEPTASLDPASENRLITRMADLIKGKTTILITHKGNMLKLVDKIILIDRGRLVAYGPRDEIIRKLQAREYTGGESA